MAHWLQVFRGHSFVPWSWRKLTAVYKSSTVRYIPGTPWQPGTGMHEIGACFLRVLQRGAGCACRHMRLILHEGRAMSTTRHPCRGYRYSARETPCAIDA